MQTPVAGQARVWIIAAAILAAVLWFLGDIVLPFVIGAGLAYFLNPVVEALARRGLPRWAAVTIIASAALGALVLAMLALVPTLISQATALFETAPAALNALTGWLTERFPDQMLDDDGLRQMTAQIGDWARTQGGEVLARVMTSARSLFGVLLLLVVVPVVTFYLLLDWPRVMATIDELLPRDHAPVIRDLAAQIDRSVSAYVRGMGTVCLGMATWYGIGLMAVGLQFGLVIGAIAGLLTFIPYLGALIGAVLALGFGLFQFWGDWWSVGLVALVFGAGQAVESNVITPKVLGRAVGVHPVWLLFALSVMGALFGLVGMLVAVPLAAAAGVLVRHGTRVYMASKLYGGGAP